MASDLVNNLRNVRKAIGKLREEDFTPEDWATLGEVAKHVERIYLIEAIRDNATTDC